MEATNLVPFAASSVDDGTPLLGSAGAQQGMTRGYSASVSPFGKIASAGDPEFFNLNSVIGFEVCK